VVRELPELPHFGDARKQRLRLMAAVQAEAAEKAAAVVGGESDEVEDAADYDPNSMDAQELFLHNRVWLTTEDPWWFSQRLLVLPAAENEPGSDTAVVATGVIPASVQTPVPAVKLSGDGFESSQGRCCCCASSQGPVGAGGSSCRCRCC